MFVKRFAEVNFYLAKRRFVTSGESDRTVIELDSIFKFDRAEHICKTEIPYQEIVFIESQL